MSGFPVLLPELQRHFILMFHKYSQSVFQFPHSSEGADRFLGEGMQLTFQLGTPASGPASQRALCGTGRAEAAGHGDGFETSLIPAPSWGCSVSEQGQEQGWHHPLPLAMPQMAPAASWAPARPDGRGGTDEQG